MEVGSTEQTDRLFGRLAAELAGTGAEADVTAEIERPDQVETSVLDQSGGTLIDRSTRWPAPDISTQMTRPILADRQCSRTGCSDVAAVTLSYHYGQSQVWIDNLSPEREPHMYDMCSTHAQRLSVPRGWHLDDRRGARRTDLVAV